jgi:hypothetical protein
MFSASNSKTGRLLAVPCVWLVAVLLVVLLRVFKSYSASNRGTQFKSIHHTFEFLCVQAVTVSTLAFGYSTFLVYLSKLAQCQTVVFANTAMPSHVLSVDGNIACYQWWQVLSIVVLVCLAALPAAFCIMLSQNLKISRHVDGRARDVLCSCFTPRCYLWSPLQMIYRLLMALVSSLVSDRITVLLLLCIIVLVMMMMSMNFRPWRVPYAQALDVFCYTCLIIKIALSLSSSTVTAVARSPAPGSSITMMMDNFVVADTCLLLLPVICLLAIYAVLIMRALRRWRLQGSHKLSVALVSVADADFGKSTSPSHQNET